MADQVLAKLVKSDHQAKIGHSGSQEGLVGDMMLLPTVSEGTTPRGSRTYSTDLSISA